MKHGWRRDEAWHRKEVNDLLDTTKQIQHPAGKHLNCFRGIILEAF